MLIEKIVEKGVEIAVGAACTAFAGAVTYMLLSGNKDSRDEHNARITRLNEEYNALIAENK